MKDYHGDEILVNVFPDSDCLHMKFSYGTARSMYMVLDRDKAIKLARKLLQAAEKLSG